MFCASTADAIHMFPFDEGIFRLTLVIAIPSSLWPSHPLDFPTHECRKSRHPVATGVSPLAITNAYSQSPAGGAPLAAGLCLAYNGNMIVYSQYFPNPFVVLAGEGGESIISLCQP
jgi:hypothetical protein